MYAVTDPDCEEDADEATRAEFSSDEVMAQECQRKAMRWEGGAIQRGQLLCHKYHCYLCFFGIVWRLRIQTWEGSFSL